MSTPDEVQALVVGLVAESLECTATDVVLDVPLDEQGLDSLDLIRLTGRLSDRLGVPVDPTLCYEHADIPSFAAHLARMSQAARLVRGGDAESARPVVARWASVRFVAPRTPWQRRLASACAEARGVDRVGLYDPFADLGLGDVEVGAAWRAALAALGVPADLDPDTFPDVAALAATLEPAPAADGGGVSPTTLEDEAHLPEDVVPTPGAPVPERVETVLLTGATGYVGAYLLDELLRQSDCRVVCLVRAPTPAAGLGRVRQGLARYDLAPPDVDERVEVVTGDLALPHLGLDDDAWDALGERVDVVLHNGAWVNFVLPYQPLRPVNVNGTLEVLRLATGARTIPVHFISTLWILATDDEGLERTVFEDEVTGGSENLPNGYEQSKWVADRMVQQAMSRGLPATIHRLGLMSGESVHGRYHQVGDFLSSFVKGCIQMGAMPYLDQELEMVPVDFCAELVVSRVLDPAEAGRCFHLTHPEAASVTDALPVLEGLGFPLRALTWEEWKAEFLGLGEAVEANALAPFQEFIRPVSSHQTGLPPLDLRNFRAAVAAAGAHCPPSMDLLTSYVSSFREQGFLPARGATPPARAST